MSTSTSRNSIRIARLSHPKVVSEFIRIIRNGIEKGYGDFTISLEYLDSRVYPNTATPIAGIINHLRSQNVEFDFIGPSEYLMRSGFCKPLDVIPGIQQLTTAPLDRVWRFCNSEDINTLVDNFIQEVSQAAVCEDGVLEGLTWCLNEVMDNVLQHSIVGQGYVMGQIHRTTKHIAFCVFDTGQGIYNSLRNTLHAPRNPIDAITLAVKEGVTRDKRIGQGNGMWGLHNIVKLNSGRLAITSNGGCYMTKGDEAKTFKGLPYLSQQNGFTTIDFQIDFDKGISIANALGGHQPVSLRLEALEDERGNMIYKLADKSSGTGTRQSGERIRNEIINLYKETQKGIEIDFASISVVSSSFADELIGKLVMHFGFAGFNQIFRLKNMNTTVQPIIDRSVFQRVAEIYQSTGLK